MKSAMMERAWRAAAMAVALAAAPAGGQSSSLFVQPTAAPGIPQSSRPADAPAGQPAAPVPPPAAAPAPRGPAAGPTTPVTELAAASFAAVKAPEPRQFAVNDLVTVVVREATESGANTKLDTTKDFSVDGTVSAFPNLSLDDLLRLRVGGGTLTNPPKVGAELKSEFKGDGDYSRKDSFTTRLTARIIDVKPNGTLVLEARKYIQSEKETLEMVLTGTCRREDVAVDNTVQSTQLYDLRLVKHHSGELHRAGEKGLITQLFDFLFNF